MKKVLLGILLFGSIVLSCQKDEIPRQYAFEAEVLGLNSDCGIYMVKILKGTAEMKSIVGSSASDSTYIAKNLPSDLKTVGLKIVLDARKPKNDELGACTFLGPSYPWLYVERAKKK